MAVVGVDGRVPLGGIASGSDCRPNTAIVVVKVLFRDGACPLQVPILQGWG